MSMILEWCILVLKIWCFDRQPKVTLHITLPLYPSNYICTICSCIADPSIYNIFLILLVLMAMYIILKYFLPVLSFPSTTCTVVHCTVFPIYYAIFFLSLFMRKLPLLSLSLPSYRSSFSAIVHFIYLTFLLYLSPYVSFYAFFVPFFSF